MFQYLASSEFENCIRSENIDQAVCVEAPDGSTMVPGKLVLAQLSNVFPLLSDENESAKDIAIIIVVGLFFKILYIAGILTKTSKVSKFVPDA